MWLEGFLKTALIFTIIVTVLVQKVRGCEAQCYFNESYISSDTIKKWPSSCETVCGNLYFNAKSDLSESQLKTYLGKLQTLNGYLKFEYTNLTSFNFLPNRITVDCDKNGIIISHNLNLTDIESVQWWQAPVKCIWHFVNNSKLDMKAVCDDDYKLGGRDLDVYGNFKDCRCKNVRIDSKSLPFYQNCTKITSGFNGGLRITNFDDHSDLSGLLRLKKLEGNLEIYETGLQNITFLGNLQNISSERYSNYNHTDIRNNPKMTRLGLDSLTTLLPDLFGFEINIVNNHPDFCLATKELQVFAESSVKFHELEATLCPDLIRKDGQKVCKYDTLATLDADCIHIIGDVVVNSDNENDIWKLKNLTHVYGSLTIKDTKKLEDLGVLENLRQVAYLFTEGPPILRFLSNEKLQTVALPSMKTAPYLIGYNVMVIEINGNILPIFPSRKECMLFQRKTNSMVKYNGHGCMKLPQASEVNQNSTAETSDKVAKAWNYLFSVLLITFLSCLL